MLRIVGSVVAGALTAFATIFLIELLGHAVYPIPADAAIDNPEQPLDPMRMPLPALLIVVFAWFAGALAGGAVAKKIRGRWWSAWLIAILVAFAGIFTITLIAHPTWMQFAAVIAPLLGGLAANHLVRGERRADANL